MVRADPDVLQATAGIRRGAEGEVEREDTHRRGHVAVVRFGSHAIRPDVCGDADSDGLHIATLLCALFLRHFRPLVANGHVYVAMPPLYRIDAGKNIYYALDEAERDQILKKIETSKETKAKPSVTRFKGLGEMNPSQLRETTMDPRTRRLVQLTIAAKDDSDQLMDMLLAKKRASDRKDWLEEKGNLAEVIP